MKKGYSVLIKKRRLLGAVSLIILIVLLIVALVQWNLIKNPLSKITSKKESISVTDSCAIVVGKLIHPIPDEDICRNRCLDACSIRSKLLVGSDFKARENDCNDCTCACK